MHFFILCSSELGLAIKMENDIGYYFTLQYDSWGYYKFDTHRDAQGVK